MKLLPLMHFYSLAAKIHGVFNGLHHQRLADLFGPLTDAQKMLDRLIKDDPLALPSVKEPATQLLTQLGALFDKHFIDPTTHHVRFPNADEKIDVRDLLLLDLSVKNCEQAISAALSHVAVFAVAPRGVYNATEMLNHAHHAIPAHVKAHVPIAVCDELDQVGRALSCDLGTAATMHGLRALELMTASYYEEFAPPLTNRNERNFATYIRKLSELADDDSAPVRPDNRLIQTLNHVKETYRTPLLQSDMSVNSDTAATFFGLIVSIITQLADRGKNTAALPSSNASQPAAQQPATKPTPPPAVTQQSVISRIENDAFADDDSEQDTGIYDFKMSQASAG